MNSQYFCPSLPFRVGIFCFPILFGELYNSELVKTYLSLFFQASGLLQVLFGVIFFAHHYQLLGFGLELVDKDFGLFLFILEDFDLSIEDKHSFLDFDCFLLFRGFRSRLFVLDSLWFLTFFWYLISHDILCLAINYEDRKHRFILYLSLQKSGNVFIKIQAGQKNRK